jgi:O-antigen ligase
MGYGREAIEERVHSYLLGFNRASVGLFAYVGLGFLLLRSWLGGIRFKSFLYIAAPLVTILLLDSFSRAALLAAFAGGLTLVLRLKVKRTLSLIVTAALGTAIILLVVADVSEWVERFAALFSREAFQRSTGGGRVRDWLLLLGFLGNNVDYLVFGIGFHRYSEYKMIGGPSLAAGHNMYVHTLGELGILGLAAFLVLWAILFVTLYRLSKRKTRGPLQPLICAAVFAIYVGLLVSGLSQETLYPQFTMYNVVPLLMTIFGVTIGTFRNVPAFVPGHEMGSDIDRLDLPAESPRYARV